MPPREGEIRKPPAQLRTKRHCREFAALLYEKSWKPTKRHCRKFALLLVDEKLWKPLRTRLRWPRGLTFPFTLGLAKSDQLASMRWSQIDRTSCQCATSGDPPDDIRLPARQRGRNRNPRISLQTQTHHQKSPSPVRGVHVKAGCRVPRGNFVQFSNPRIVLGEAGPHHH
jgi:hypothetical protein